MTDQGEDGLRRWSRRKSEHRLQQERNRDGQEPARSATGGAPPAELPRPAASAAPADASAELPDPATLTRESDFTPFLRAEVPDALHRQALRALWRSDPALTAMDGLTDYGEDMRSVGTVPGVVATAYRVGKGYVAASDETADNPGSGPSAANATENTPGPTGAHSGAGPSGEDAAAAKPEGEPSPAEPSTLEEKNTE